MFSSFIANNGRFNVRDYGAIGDGASHPLSDHYGTLAAAQRFYPPATSLSDEVDWAALQTAVNAATAAGGGRIHVPHASAGYEIGSKTVTIGGSGVVFEAEDGGTYLRYSGTDYALSFSITGAKQLHRCGTVLLGVVCSNPAGSALYAKSPYGFFIDHGYFENAHGGTTGAGITVDAGMTSRGNGYFATHNVVYHTRCNGFLKGILFKGGSLGGRDVATASAVVECFVNSLVGLRGSVGVEFQGSQQCTVRGGNLESLDYGVKLVSTPNRCIGITLDTVRFEAIAVNNWLIPADSENCTIVSPRWSVDNGIDLARDTVVLQNNQSRFNTVRLNKKPVACVNGNNNHTLDRAGASLVRITGPTAAFAIGGFTLDTGGSAATDGTELTVYNSTEFAMTIKNADPAAKANCGIRTPQGGDLAQPAGRGGSSARFVYDASFSQWVLVGHTG
jgi:hypothetical protein